jgi:hypothetical protein
VSEDLGYGGSPHAQQLRHDIRALMDECLAALRRGDGQETWRELETRIAQLQERLHTIAKAPLRD